MDASLHWWAMPQESLVKAAHHSGASRHIQFSNEGLKSLK